MAFLVAQTVATAPPGAPPTEGQATRMGSAPIRISTKFFEVLMHYPSPLAHSERPNQRRNE